MLFAGAQSCLGCDEGDASTTSEGAGGGEVRPRLSCGRGRRGGEIEYVILSIMEYLVD